MAYLKGGVKTQNSTIIVISNTYTYECDSMNNVIIVWHVKYLNI